MAITITSEQMYLAGNPRKTPQTDSASGIKYCEAGYASDSASNRYVTQYTCYTDTPLSQVTLTVKSAGQSNTSLSNSRYLGVYVTTSENGWYLVTATGGDTKLCFSCTCADDETPYTGVGTGYAVSKVTKNIPTGTFYVYVVPYNDSKSKTYSTFYSKSSTVTPAAVSGTSIPIYKVTLNNQSATTAGTAAVWYVYNTYFSPYYYYTDSGCTTGLANHTITKPTKTGYTFGGYFTSTGGGGTQYVTADGAFTNSIYKVNNNQTLYAKWTGNQYTLVVNPNGGSFQGSTSATTMPVKLQYGTGNYHTIGAATRSGYTLNGYYTAASGGTKVYNADGTCVTGTAYFNASRQYCYTGNLTVYAQWTANQYTLTVDPNGGTYNGSAEAQALSPKMQYGTTNWCAIGAAVRPGYKLNGYYTSALDGTKVYNADGTCVAGTSYWNSSTQYIHTGDLVVYAQWSADGLAYADNGSSVDGYAAWIDNGTEFGRYAPHIDNGTGWDFCG